MSYSKRYYVMWRGRESHRYLMNRCLELARRMRRRGHLVTVHYDPLRRA